jgi:glycosyltransferase involved in cell wall biosynthesis
MNLSYISANGIIRLAMNACIQRENARYREHSVVREKMKVCIVSTHYPSDDAIGEYCGHMAAELSKIAEVVVLANKNPKLPTVSRIQPNGGTRNYTVLRIWKPGLFYPFTIFRSLIRQKPDIVHVQHEYFLYGKGYDAVLFPTILLLVRLSRIPLVVTMHHVIPREEVDYIKKLLNTLVPEVLIKAFLTAFNGVFAFSSKIIVPSITFKKTLSTDYKIRDKQIEVVQHFTDTNVQRFLGKDDTEAKALLGLNEKKVILFYGFIRPTKGIEYVVYALQKVKDIVPNVVFLIDGRAHANYATYFNYLKQLVNDLELSSYVRFEEHVPEELSPVIFAASDVAVFPYTSTIGMTPIAHLKAAAYGKPIIATNIESFNKEFVDHENALLVPPKNPDALSKSIVEIFTDDVLSKKLSNNIAQYCAQRSKEKVIGGIIKIYQDILEQKKGDRGFFN